jgi:hypothetical protein
MEIEQSHQALTGVSSATTYSNDEYKIIGLVMTLAIFVLTKQDKIRLKPSTLCKII